MTQIFRDYDLVIPGALNLIAHLPKEDFNTIVTEGFFKKLTDADFMRIAVFLAQKSYDEGGCPIGGVIIDNETRQIVGKGYNRLVQDNNPVSHGETAAIIDAGRIDFSKTTLFTTLTPCDWCVGTILKLSFNRVVVGNATSVEGNIGTLDKDVTKVDILEDQKGIDLYEKFRKEKPKQDIEDWKGLAAVR